MPPLTTIVHLDLKGAPLKIPYLEKVILSAKSWGATGILLEWEDTFPYTGTLSDIGSINGKEGMYTETEVRYIMDIAKKNELEAIQLIQTIGHLEFVLKHPQFRCLRESPRSPAVLCPSKPESQLLIRSMLEQALDLQPEANYLHIGADEVWHMGVCTDCKEKAAASPYGAASLFLNHIRDLILFIKERRPNLTILMWDDMLRGINPDILGAFNLGDLVQPVVWDYNSMEYFRINPNLWNKYNRIFPQVWAGSAFKGANGSCQISSPVSRYVSNHEAWLREITNYKHRVNFSGIVLTGWSRYDHYCTLCELMPLSMPSLASCLKILQKNTGTSKETLVSEVLPAEQWPGERFARCVHSFAIVKERCLTFLHGDLVTSWLNPWQIEHSYTSPTQVEGIAVTAQQLLRDLTALHTEMSSHLDTITGFRRPNQRPVLCPEYSVRYRCIMSPPPMR
ncbi:hypothetical protein K1T71_007460 [Dendrolimus kikuchii]|uniref:Uncharacterized protein n=1 Tax=Dendrolimus kikuchii TaxID=765133 RepID=A0ACC1D0I2_9NEOP|nr:hypothetical protein K1T71_007460 [Dendrolimus kikuchii]